MINLNSALIIKVLGHCFINSDEKFYGRQLAKKLEVDPGNLPKKLAELEQEGFLSADIKGRQRYFKINKHYPFLAETKRLYEAKFSVVLVLKDILRQVKNLQEAYLFGSAVQYWGIIAIVDARKIKVIIRKIGNGSFHFWGVIPAWTTNKYRDTKFFTTMKGCPEED